ncbi:DUF2510 domain-containing protein [Nocardioides sp. TF02-7]|uniref:DUF2510 domain-containing protein n=1 Tax=Nocardioides sp. TF02-7 TaxID=2917724 RepID=UPI001F0512CD|nr:DUF2510 domain-containing protein [Nocardioides sp. TF02-7]UMG93562.1 PASTA domain-containing protein [Nocardioides sp. TF02-7]
MIAIQGENVMADSTSTPGAGARADWYADPHNPAQLRYWDGRRWTAHIAPRPADWGGPQWTTYAPRPGDRRTGETGRRRSGLPGWAIAGLAVFVGLVGLVVVGSVLSVVAPEPEQPGNASAADPGSPTQEPSSTPTSTTPAPTPTETETEPPTSVVPRLVGLTRAKAEARLTAVGLDVGDVRQAYSRKAPGTVLRQSAEVGASVLTGTSVVLVVAKAYPKVPGVVGRRKAAAVARLRDAGFKVDVTTEKRSSGKDGVVLRQTPAGAARAKPGSSVSIVVSNVVRPAPTHNCTAGYDPCLPARLRLRLRGRLGRRPGLHRVRRGDRLRPLRPRCGRRRRRLRELTAVGGRDRSDQHSASPIAMPPILGPGSGTVRRTSDTKVGAASRAYQRCATSTTTRWPPSSPGSRNTRIGNRARTPSPMMVCPSKLLANATWRNVS